MKGDSDCSLPNAHIDIIPHNFAAHLVQLDVSFNSLVDISHLGRLASLR